MSKKVIVLTWWILSAFSLCAQNSTSEGIFFKDATELTIIGKLMTNTSNPYHRVDTIKYKGFTELESEQIRSSSGIAVVFRTDSHRLYVRAKYGYKCYDQNTMGVALRGFDLYIKDSSEWLWAHSACPALGEEDKEFLLLGGMDGEMKECLIYLPLYSELYKLEIGIEENSSIEPVPNPFRHRIGVYGSSYTQGISATRPGMAYPAQLSRKTGLQMLSLGCSGNCKMQDYFASVLCDADVDAFLFDTFSNPEAPMIRERLFLFIEQVQVAHPGIPLIFQQTIYRERRNFNNDVETIESEKQKAAEELMKEACKRYDDVFLIRPNATAPNHETSVDGIHPSDEGYRMWMESIRKPVTKILKKYNIK